MSQHTELVPRLRNGADFHESEGDIGLPYLLRQAADTIEALSVNPLREALENLTHVADNVLHGLTPGHLAEPVSAARKALGEQP